MSGRTHVTSKYALSTRETQGITERIRRRKRHFTPGPFLYLPEVSYIRDFVVRESRASPGRPIENSLQVVDREVDWFRQWHRIVPVSIRDRIETGKHQASTIEVVATRGDSLPCLRQYGAVKPGSLLNITDGY